MNKIYMGWDSREQLAYDVAEFSIRTRTNDVEVIPLKLADLPMLNRPIEYSIDGKMFDPISQAPMATEFAISRFCIPFLQDSGWALFVDCDIVCREDIQHLFDLADDKYAIMCVKHVQKDTGAVKMDGQVQTYYSRKNWSSVMLWNLNHLSNKKLTLEMLNTLPGRDLHAFCWLQEEEIGELPQKWNHLVNVTPLVKPPAILHYTLGGAWFPGWRATKTDSMWLKEKGKFLKARKDYNST